MTSPAFSWAYELTEISPRAKLLAIFIASRYSAGWSVKVSTTIAGAFALIPQKGRTFAEVAADVEKALQEIPDIGIEQTADRAITVFNLPFTKGKK